MTNNIIELLNSNIDALEKETRRLQAIVDKDRKCHRCGCEIEPDVNCFECSEIRFDEIMNKAFAESQVKTKTLRCVSEERLSELEAIEQADIEAEEAKN